eukprot:gnl/TRDRNA2_/TRDRNA2_135302_c0_seq2.p1 gnl/TRDRNA2_/TRDRNA2_135302_c0~~gnl/TRDRNA2_/TRDRNA2_135302_c0_seq2.p1  ORF type:complete len:112 (+),score=5.07 gnl/TRDRNA2_/TRDRNA2_135302_c0_seq2:167-502(+)
MCIRAIMRRRYDYNCNGADENWSTKKCNPTLIKDVTSSVVPKPSAGRPRQALLVLMLVLVFSCPGRGRLGSNENGGEAIVGITSKKATARNTTRTTESTSFTYTELYPHEV